jgi:hypothetical protein
MRQKVERDGGTDLSTVSGPASSVMIKAMGVDEAALLQTLDVVCRFQLGGTTAEFAPSGSRTLWERPLHG